jgi:predicted RNA methylase
MKLTKEQSKAHQKAMDLVHSDKKLTWDERKYILDNYSEQQGQLNTLAGAFFTPFELANDFSIEVGYSDGGGSMIDLCAGIGALSFACQDKELEITCVEMCEAYVVVGKRVMPSANWVHADCFSVTGKFDFAVSNPPFGAIKGGAYDGLYTGSNFEYKVISHASTIAKYGVFILPQQSAPFRYSGERHFREEENEKVAKFREQTGILMQPNCGIDTALYKNEWRGVSPICEVVCCDFEHVKEKQETLF